MNIKKRLLRWTVAILTVLILAACGSSPTSAPIDGNNIVEKSGSGQVTFAVQFPHAALNKALINNSTLSINIEWNAFNNQSLLNGSVTLIPNPVTGVAMTTVSVPVGNMEFRATALGSNNSVLDRTATAGEITSGINTVTLTFLNGDWKFVDAGDNPLPQTFGAKTLAGFTLQPGQNNSGPARATIDPTKPRNWSDYQLQWQDATSAYGPLMWAGQEAQFNAPAATGSAFHSDWLNITDPARSDSNNNSNSNSPAVPYLAGDRIVWIMYWKDGDGPDTITTDVGNIDLIPAFRTNGDSQVLDANHLGGHLLAMSFESLVSAPLDTNANCMAFYAQRVTPAAARAAAIKASLTRGAGKATIGVDNTLAAGTASVKYVDCYQNFQASPVDADGDNNFIWENLTFDANFNGFVDAGDTYNDIDGDGRWDYVYYPGTTYDVTEKYSNIVAREFRAKGFPRGNVYALPSAIGSYTGNSYLSPMPTPIANINFAVDSSGALIGKFIDLTDNNQRYDLATQVNLADGTLSATFNLITSGDLITITGTVTSGTWTRTGTTFMTGTYSTRKVVPSITASAVGTFLKIDPINNTVAVVSFIDSSNYIMGEDGVADPPYGGPGIEVGTYSLNTTTGMANFNVTYENNGDWGPAKLGTPSSILVAALNATGLTLFDPKDGLFTLDRVMTNPGNPIVGSWYFTGTGMGATVLVLLNNGTYHAVQVDSVDSTNRFFESGTYTWNSVTNAFSGTGVTSTNPSNSAIAAPGETNPMTITISGNTLTLLVNSSTYTATRL